MKFSTLRRITPGGVFVYQFEILPYMRETVVVYDVCQQPTTHPKDVENMA